MYSRPEIYTLGDAAVVIETLGKVISESFEGLYPRGFFPSYDLDE